MNFNLNYLKTTFYRHKLKKKKNTKKQQFEKCILNYTLNTKFIQTKNTYIYNIDFYQFRN